MGVVLELEMKTKITWEMVGVLVCSTFYCEQKGYVYEKRSLSKSRFKSSKGNVDLSQLLTIVF